jgi:PII-like signaling protein
MNGFQITFFTQQNSKHKGRQLAEWLLDFARSCGVQGGTIIAGSESYGKDGHFHSAHFFELADQPLAVIMAADHATTERLFAGLKQEKVAVFYVKTAVEFGSLDDASC